MGLITNSLTGVGVNDLAAIANWAAANGILELEAGRPYRWTRKNGAKPLRKAA
jgi:hypothetical protein